MMEQMFKCLLNVHVKHVGIVQVVLLVDDVVPGPDGHQVGVVGGGGDGDGARAPHVGVAQLVGQLLKLVSVEVVVIPEDVIVAGPGGALDSLVGHQVEVSLCGVVYPLVDDSAGQGIPVLVLVGVCREESESLMRILYTRKQIYGYTWCGVSSAQR